MRQLIPEYTHEEVENWIKNEVTSNTKEDEE